jgi:hypothetical protein
MKRLIFACLFLLLSSTLYAQTHYCDQTQPTTGTGIAGQTLVVTLCNDGKDSTGTVTLTPTSFKLYDNNAATVIGMTKGTTSATSGKSLYTGSYVVPPTGVHVLQTTALAGTNEGPKSPSFTLTVVAAVPSAPTNLTAQ